MDHQSTLPPNSNPSDLRSLSNPSQRPEVELKDSIAARKVQKADREKLRRDRLNEQFIELGNALDPDRPKNDKATILADTIQVLKDLTDQVNKLKSEYGALTEESRELTQEKNDLREEKATLKSDIESLNLQYQQRARPVFPWSAMDHSVVMGPPSYPYPVPVPIPAGPIPMHPSMQPYPFFGNQTPGMIPNAPTFIPYLTPSSLIEQQSTQYMAPPVQPSSRSHVSAKQDSKRKSPGHGETKTDKSEDCNDVVTDLELKTPGSTSDQDLSSAHKKSKKTSRKENNSITDGGSSSSRCSSSRSVHESSSNSVVGGAKEADD